MTQIGFALNFTNKNDFKLYNISLPYIGNGCVYKSKVYEIGEDFYDDCNQFCFCSETGEAICNPIGKNYAFKE